ncbi:MAG: hypothetical protein AAFX01_02005 [Cyanobacteria bacterium J06638_28]
METTPNVTPGAPLQTVVVSPFAGVLVHPNPKGKSNDDLQQQIDSVIKSLAKVDIPHWLNTELSDAVAIAMETTTPVASLKLHYEFMSGHKQGDRRISATTGRFCRMLYKEWVRAICP